MSKHSHKCSCNHEAVSFCKCCNTVWCKDCNQEWTAKSVFTYPYPWYSNTNGLVTSAGSNSLGQVTSLSNSLSDSPTLTVAKACEHKG